VTLSTPHCGVRLIHGSPFATILDIASVVIDQGHMKRSEIAHKRFRFSELRAAKENRP
jgi:hypothetical protein